MEAEVGVMCFKDGGRHHEPKNVGSLWMLDEARKQVLL